ncbi:hypothetical protein [Jiangella anatolica]|uniref:Uncharacterized protein n=1 Tax=Jiangella anatolica TaxID=2670374 RepID=A0A2W2CCN1_9ACTN|nr:hypothetical protein [Jiangella anatolica]PZF86057.1 hypothetical protein C1I92_02405 [Jiangella anatolica]
MTADEARYADCMVGELHVSVLHLGVNALGSDEVLSRFAWRVESTNPDLPGTFTNSHLHAASEIELSAQDGLRLAAHVLIEAGEDYRAGELERMSFPLWLSAMAHRNLGELALFAWTGMSPAEVRADGIPLDRQLLAVEVARHVLDAESALTDAGMLGPEAFAELRRITAAADREVSIPDPDDPLGPPLYEGPAGEAHARLVSGQYDAHARHDPTQELVVVVADSELLGTRTAAAFDANRAIHRTRMARTNGRAPSAGAHQASGTPWPFDSSTPQQGPGRTEPPAPGL